MLSRDCAADKMKMILLENDIEILLIDIFILLFIRKGFRKYKYIFLII